ncbi:biopolymer transporter ExbD [Hymenobacter sp. BT186]|uniref:Biopolymer transporter ExbD n=1 Tax=Hymenobacter telluris TaxID=2816474 RepID=A0A939EZU9_9BACT|nr:biopolymer transporter ExbD [Hymenobacter telluris]MBO0360528.1 biopolymer transporter ExbD [Hymenobacter telluris]MBW3376555.1 biopolymer transporter ExbD [Hymenobacter norwichensis]
MAEIASSAPAGRGPKPRRKKLSTRIDMTPMVDLAFLLLTFFILTASFNKPTVMALTMPDKKGEPSDLGAKQALTLILGKDSQVHYFFGLNSAENPAKLYTTTFGSDGLRKVLLERQRQLPAPTVLIKAGQDAKYRDLVDALDEMTITDQQKYALVDLTAADRELLEKNSL